MTANLVTGLSPMQDIKSGMAANLNPVSGTDFSDVLKNSTDKGNDVNVPQPKEPVKNKTGEAKEAGGESSKAGSGTDEVRNKNASEKPAKVEDKSVKEPEDDAISDEAMEEIAATVSTMVQTIATVLEIPVTQASVDFRAKAEYLQSTKTRTIHISRHLGELLLLKRRSRQSRVGGDNLF